MLPQVRRTRPVCAACHCRYEYLPCAATVVAKYAAGGMNRDTMTMCTPILVCIEYHNDHLC